MAKFAAKFHLSPTQIRAVASWRFDDATCLWRTGLSKHMNGAVYLAGLALDCLLKAALLANTPTSEGEIRPILLRTTGVAGTSSTALTTPRRRSPNSRTWSAAFRA